MNTQTVNYNKLPNGDFLLVVNLEDNYYTITEEDKVKVQTTAEACWVDGSCILDFSLEITLRLLQEISLESLSSILALISKEAEGVGHLIGYLDAVKSN